VFLVERTNPGKSIFTFYLAIVKCEQGFVDYIQKSLFGFFDDIRKFYFSADIFEEESQLCPLRVISAFSLCNIIKDTIRLYFKLSFMCPLE